MALLARKRDTAKLALGEGIKARRKELGLTLQQLADRSGLSAPFISQAERDLTIPSLVSLLALAKGLEVDVSHFIRIPDDGKVVHRGSKPRRILVNSPVQYFDLSSEMANRQLDVILMRIPAGHVFPVDQRNGEDVLYLLEGELYATAGRTKTVLKAGDSMHFDSRLPHSARNRSDREAVLLYIGTPSVFSGQPARKTKRARKTKQGRKARGPGSK